MKKLVFDLDGTLYNKQENSSLPVGERSINFLEKHLQLSREKAEEVWLDLLSKYKYGIMNFEKVNSFSREDFCDYVCDVDDMSYAEIVDELNQVLLSLEHDKYIFTDNTNKQTIKTLKYLGIDLEHFKSIFHAKSGDFLFKPHQDVYEKFLQENKLIGSDCIMFEDSVANLKPAKELGMVTVLINPKLEKTDFCDYCFADIVQALNYLQSQDLLVQAFMKNFKKLLDLLTRVVY